MPKEIFRLAEEEEEGDLSDEGDFGEEEEIEEDEE